MTSSVGGGILPTLACYTARKMIAVPLHRIVFMDLKDMVVKVDTKEWNVWFCL